MEESFELDPNPGVADRGELYFIEPTTNPTALLIPWKFSDKIVVSVYSSVVNEVNKGIEEIDKAVKTDSKQVGEQLGVVFNKTDKWQNVWIQWDYGTG